jgi:hypothetical protein
MDRGQEENDRGSTFRCLMSALTFHLEAYAMLCGRVLTETPTKKNF